MKDLWEDVHEIIIKWLQNHEDNTELQQCKGNLFLCAKILRRIHDLWTYYKEDLETRAARQYLESSKTINASVLISIDRLQALFPQDRDIKQFNSYIHNLQSVVPSIGLRPLPVELLVLLDYFLAKKFNFVAGTRTDREKFINGNLGKISTMINTLNPGDLYGEVDIIDAFIGMYGSSTYTAFKCSVHDIASVIKNITDETHLLFFWCNVFKDLFGTDPFEYLEIQRKEIFITTFPPKPE